VHVDGGLLSHDFFYRIPSLFQASIAPDQIIESATEESFDVWHRIVNGYTPMHLSMPGDKLLAISAAADAMSSTFLDLHAAGSYKAGLWEQHMPLNLLWSVTPMVLKSRPLYRAPSWSWASVDQEADVYGYRLLSQCHPSCYPAEIIQCNIQLASSAAPYGQVLGGELRIESLVKDIPHYSISDGEITLSDPEYRVERTGGLDAIEPDLTQPREPGSGFTISLLLIIRLPSTEVEWDAAEEGNFGWLYGLILRKRDGETVVSRIGVLDCLVSKGDADGHVLRWQDSFERKTITIV